MADITYVPTWAEFVFLAVVLDVFSRRIVGWSMADPPRTELVLEALNMAVGQRRPEAVIHHSDSAVKTALNNNAGRHPVHREQWSFPTGNSGASAWCRACEGVSHPRSPEAVLDRPVDRTTCTASG